MRDLYEKFGVGQGGVERLDFQVGKWDKKFGFLAWWCCFMSYEEC